MKKLFLAIFLIGLIVGFAAAGSISILQEYILAAVAVILMITGFFGAYLVEQKEDRL